MSDVTDIDAIVADPTIAREAKRKKIRKIRARAWARLASNVPLTFFNGTITITEVRLLPNDDVLFMGSGGNIDWPLIVRNPPILQPDPAGDVTIDGVTYSIAPRAILKDLLGRLRS